MKPPPIPPRSYPRRSSHCACAGRRITHAVADLLGKTDEKCIVAMLSIGDAQFHAPLVAEAVQARKLPADFRIPAAWSANTASSVRAHQRNVRAPDLLPDYPFGSDFDALELRLLAASHGGKGVQRVRSRPLSAGCGKYNDQYLSSCTP